MKWIPKILSLILLWGSVGAVIFLLDPELIRDILIPGSYLPFFALFAVTIWYTLAIIIKSLTMSFLLTITLVGSLILTMLKLMHWGLAVVLLLTLVIESWYIYHSHEKINSTDEQKN